MDDTGFKRGPHPILTKKVDALDELFLSEVDKLSKLATCARGYCGCVIVNNGRVISSGYVKSPRNTESCNDVGHAMYEHTGSNGVTTQHCGRTIHAEQVAICEAASLGHSTKGATIYTSLVPCKTCANLIVECGIKKVIAKNMYQTGADSIKLFNRNGIEIIVLSMELTY